MPSPFRRTIDYFRTLLTNLYFWGGLALLGLLAFGAYLFFDNVLMPQYTRHDVSVTVPEVAGVPVEKAREQLEERDLRVETLEERYNPSVERGAVIEQNPRGGRSVKPGRRVYLTVNTGEQPMVKVPRVVDASLREAKNRLRSLGLTVGEVQKDSIPSPYANTVTRQQPAAGDSLPKGTAVSLWYSTGNQSAPYTTVPDVTGQTVKEARQTLLDRKLRAVVVRPSEGEEGDAQPAPEDEQAQQEDVNQMKVVRQSREPDTRVREGFEVRLHVEEGGNENPQSGS